MPMLQQPDLSALLTPAMLQQSRGPSRFGSTGTTPGMHDHCSTGTPTCLQQQGVPNVFMQQESVSYLGANAGLLADASTLAAAAAAVAHNGAHAAGQHSCHTPMAGSQPPAFAGEAMCGSHTGAAATGMSAPAMPQQHHWLNLHRQHFSSSTGSLPGLASGPSVFAGGADFCSAGGNLVASLVGDASPCGTPTYLQQGLPGPAPVMGTKAWCGQAGGNGNTAGGARSSGWW
jgi:hypothetical protein